KHLEHSLAADSHQRAVAQCACRTYPYRLSCKASFSEIVPFFQNCDGSFFPAFGNHRNPHLALANVEDCVCGVALRKEHFPFSNCLDVSCAVGQKELFRIEWAAISYWQRGRHKYL